MLDKHIGKKFVEELFTVSDDVIYDVVSFIKRNLSPEDVFDNSDLADWAESNGYVLEKDQQDA